jgi:hypothetical protein
VLLPNVITTRRLRARFAVQADYDRYTSINFEQDDTVLSLSMSWMTARVGGALGLNYYAAPREGDVTRGGSDAGFITP